MDILNKIIETYSEIKPTDNFLNLGIELRDDGDGIVYLYKWEYSKPIPKGLKLGKPSA
jgi:hypothetical protein